MANSKFDNGKVAMPLAERIAINSRVDKNGCWRWQKSIKPDGYVDITIGSRRNNTRKSVKAHRVSYEAFIGPIPEGLTIDHLCRVRDCVNPEHLEAVSMKENTMRSPISPTAVNARKERCPSCGGNYSTKKDGSRYCSPCALNYFRWYNDNHRNSN